MGFFNQGSTLLLAPLRATRELNVSGLMKEYPRMLGKFGQGLQGPRGGGFGGLGI